MRNKICESLVLRDDIAGLPDGEEEAEAEADPGSIVETEEDSQAHQPAYTIPSSFFWISATKNVNAKVNL